MKLDTQSFARRAYLFKCVLSSASTCVADRGGKSFSRLVLSLLKTSKYKGHFRVPPGPLYQNEVKCSAFDMEINFTLMQIKLIFTRKDEHLASF